MTRVVRPHARRRVPAGEGASARPARGGDRPALAGDGGVADPEPATDPHLATDPDLPLGDRTEPTGPTRVRVTGRVTAVRGLAIAATAPGARAGDVWNVATGHGAVPAEVVALRRDEAVLLPLGELRGVGPGCRVTAAGGPLRVDVGEALLGRVLDGLGHVQDGGPVPAGLCPREVDRPAPEPLARARVARPLWTGLRAIDALATLGEGQRVGLLSGPGAGKSTLLGAIARHADCDAIVAALVGERGREVREFVEDTVGSARSRAVIVAATGDAPPLVRARAAAVATTIAEWFRERGARVLLLCDSLTRWARALREVGLAAGEPPARQGFPASVFAALPRLIERAGPAARGSITGVYTVLTAADELDDPIAEEARAALDGHLVLSRGRAERGAWPALDPTASLSRVMPAVVPAEHARAAARVRDLCARYERVRDLVAIGAYLRGGDPETDRALDRRDAIERFLRQDLGERCSPEEMRAALAALAR